ncbi:Hint domain-containing protein [Roseovarius aestuarii]|nr:Hint domain-containing protein [Roseovarius aestuarii]
MAFISEVKFNGTGGAGVGSAGEYVEITLGPGDDPADFVVSAYRNNGTLHHNAGIPGGEVNLSTLTGVPDLDNPDYTIYIIPVGIRTSVSDANEASGIALTDTSAGGGVLSFYSGVDIAKITATQGAASGATSDKIFNYHTHSVGESYQWDIYGNQTIDTITPGDAVLCITGETRVKTRAGDVQGQHLKVGDLVWTLDHGYQPIRWIGLTLRSPTELMKNPKNNPVCIGKNALGNQTPTRDLLVSPQHRIFARSKIAARMFGSAEVLAPAIKLVEVDGIDQVEARNGVQYIHILFDRHEIIQANGALVESLLIAEQSEMLLEGMTEMGPVATTRMAPARALIKNKACKNFAQRIAKNSRTLVEEGAAQHHSVHLNIA